MCMYICMYEWMNVCAWCVCGKEGGCMCQAAHVVKTILWSHSFLFFHFFVGSGDEPRSQGLCGSALICWVIWPARIFFSSQIESWRGGLCFNPTSLPISTSPPHLRFSQVYIVNSPFVSKATLYGILSPFHKALFYAFSICFQINQMLFSFPFFFCKLPRHNLCYFTFTFQCLFFFQAI